MSKENSLSGDSHTETYHHGIGRIAVSSVPMPDEIKLQSGTYTYSGKVLVTYTTDKDLHRKDFFNLASMNDDGTDFKVIFSGEITAKPKANGIRFLPFQDNTRVLLGDYVLECIPDIDTCISAKLVPIVYPSYIEADPKTTHHWSEIIIAPDNKHVSWTLLRADMGGGAAIGVLEREADAYMITNVQLISSLSNFDPDPNRPGYLIPKPVRGGEVKQFVRGGSAVSVVGGKRNGTPDSIVQDLSTEEITQITHTPGYDETTIFSPDERLGIVMSTRFSKATDPAIFGLLPRPYALQTLMGMAWSLYMYAVSGVRQFRRGNIGPVMIDIQRSMNETGYQGIQLTTDEDWVYCSPMSWHPNGKHVMWPEMARGSGGSQMRLQKAELLDYEPQASVPVVETPDDIPYGIKDLSALQSVNPDIEGKIAGRSTGYMSFSRSSDGTSGKTEAEYVNFSDDGVHFYNGYEKAYYDFNLENRYEADLRLNGSTQGEMKLRATFSPVFGPSPTKLLFEADVDGNPKSYGHATYNGVTLHISDLSE
ncbi:hypothetical protein [Paenibacillus sp. LHD-38]|uniref:hypothetical protein n=1 Tax=Paenibacillus sp. LHD-38 TaxID=3072143 RepID=UPI0028104EDD|nr:hypothetical protein [Paenibacillus sp. LHD-38]MDQ8735611.1 hypothetical protein [Paenibacillus sp. LHD-38]